MKVINTWIVFHLNTDQILVQVESGKYYLQTRHAGFLEIPEKEAEEIINNPLNTIS